ncbi:secretory pathway protein Sec39-domain-containing protein [Hyaloraphidium curvatum]|nr:secretory pathway protein Sec39-domain-containing protein [Hyaloraphidium curvatum]
MDEPVLLEGTGSLFELVPRVRWETDFERFASLRRHATDARTREASAPSLLELPGIASRWLRHAAAGVASISEGLVVSRTLTRTLIRALERINQCPWQIALSPCGQFLALLQDDRVEIAKRDTDFDFGRPLATVELDFDPFRPWRRLAWSHDSKLVAVAGSDGAVDVVSIAGHHLATILNEGPEGPSDLPSRDRRRHFVDSRSGGSFAMGNVGILDPVAVLEFADPSLRRESSESAELAAGTSSELLVIGYDGLLRSYLIDGSRITVPARVPGSDQAYGSMVTVFQEGSDDAMGIVRFDHAFSFAPYHTVVAAGLVDRDTKVLVLCGRPGPRSSPSAQDDLSFWRLGGARQRYEKLGGGAPDSPSSGIASKLAGVLDKATELVSPRLTILSASLAPDRKLLATVGSAGELRIWSYATGRCVREYGREELAGLVDYLPEENLAELLRVRRVPADGDGDLAEQGHDADDAGEWSDDDEFGRGDLKSSSRTGTVTSVTSVASAASRIVSVAEGQQGATDPLNLPLLTSAQWWSPQSILLTFDTGHVMLVDLFADMETRSVLNLRFPTPPVAAVEPESAMFLTYQDATNEPKKSPNSDAASNIVTGPIKLVTNVMLWHWETEDTLVPPPGHQPKPPRLNYCTIEVTNPEEALRNRIRHGQYAAALDLCAAFNLDSDPVYKAQFETNEVTVESIDNVLGRIRDDYFVMEACVGRVPDDPETCRALLEFGLRKTGLEGDMLVDDVLELLEIESRRLEEGEEFGSDMLMVDMCRYRTDILIYLDRLRTFELIGPGRKSRARDGLPRTTSSSEIGLTSLRRMPSKPQGKAWPQFAAGFTRFRDRKLLSECADRALRCDFYALEVLFTRHGEQLLPHRLDILKVVPETVDPVSYSVLLPRVTAEGNEEPWQEHPWRDGPDWVEDQRVVAFLERGLGGPPIGEGKPVRPYPASGEAVRDWFIERIRSVDVESGLERTALSLAEVAVDDCGVIDPQMLLLRDNLRTLCHLLYETVSEGSAESGKLSLATFESMEPKDVVRLMLANVDADHIVAAVREVLSYPSDVVRRRWEDLGKVADSQVIVRSWLREAAADRRLELCCEIVEAATSRSDEPLELLRIGSDEDITELIIDCCYLCPDVDDHAMAFMNRMFDCLPEISRLERSVPKPEGGRQLLVAGDDLAGPYAERIRALDHHLVCCEILSRAGVSVPPSALAGFESDADKQLALLKKVARRAPRRRRTGQIGDREEDEEATRAEKLIGDLLVLKDFGVLDKIDTSVIYREILSSVLAAGEFETAKDLIASNAYPLPDEVAEELVLAAASEFFDNAESGERTEGGLKMAEDCLEIIPQTPRIRKELDLILATDELFRYKVWLKEGLDILPIQVRLCEDRLDLVQKRIRSDRNSPYRADRIVTLAHRLGYRGNKRAEAHVQAMLVEAALDNSDFVKASELCSNMMNGIRSSGLELDLLPRDVWSVCYRLGSADKFSNVDVRLDIVSFALCLSPEDKVAELLETHARLEQMLRVEELSDPARTVVHGLRKSSDAAVPVIWRRGSSVPFDASQALEDIKATLALLPADLSTAEDSASGVVQSEFYRAAHATPDAANSAYGFFAVDKPRDLQHLSRKERAEQNTTLRRSADRVLLKLATMDETNAGTAESTLASLAFGVLPVDTAGAVSLLLDTAKEETAQSVFDRLYPSSFNEQLALYYYSLRSLTDLADSTKADLVPRSFSPYEVMRFIGQLAGDPAWEAALVRAEKSGEPGFAAAREAVENVRRASKALRSKREDQLLQVGFLQAGAWRHANSLLPDCLRSFLDLPLAL